MARCLNNLALLDNAQGKYPEAEPLVKRALAVREKSLGPDHPDLIPSLVDNDAIEIGQAIRRVGGKPRVLRDIHPPQRQRRCCGGRVVKACRRPHRRPLPVRLPDRNGGFARLSDGP